MKRPLLASLVAALCFVSSYCSAQSNFPPTLSLKVNQDQSVTLAWSNSSPGFVLESIKSLTSLQPWTGILQNPQLVEDQLSVTQTPAATAMFYRLIAKGNPAGNDYLIAQQNADGSWGSQTEIRDTAGVVEALNTLGQTNSLAYDNGVSALIALSTLNNDDLSRQIIELSPLSVDVSTQVTNLLDSQNAELPETSYTSYPGRGWGLASGFDDSTIDTALALRALAASGEPGGLSIVNESLPGFAISTVHPFTLPPGATNLALKVSALTGNVLFQVNYPGGSSSYITLLPSQVPITINFPSVSGALTLTTSNITGSMASYTVEVGFITTNEFDVFGITTPLAYLGLAQNSDGGWGIAPKQDSQLMVTAEVLRSLGAWAGTFVGPQVFSAASAWLQAHQNSDGGVSSVTNASNADETSLAILALEVAAPRLSVSNAVSYLKNAQLSDGSWGSTAYQTALAMEAMHILPTVSQIPGQSVISPAFFTNIYLDQFVFDADSIPSQISWQVTGNSFTTVVISNRIAILTYPPGTNYTENLTFTATDPNGYSASSTANFAVSTQHLDYILAQGTSTNDSRVITGAQSVLSQAAYYTLNESNMPPGITYTTTGFSMTSSTAFTVSYNIAVSSSATTGVYGFSVQYGLENSSGNQLGPLTNNVFNFDVEVNP